LVYTASLRLHKDAVQDLDQLRKDVPGVHARLVALLAQIKSDETLLAKLLDHGYGKDRAEIISVKKWFAPGKNLWRLRYCELEEFGWQYRLIYVYLPEQVRFVVMGVFPREDFDYDDPNNPLHRRVLESLAKTFGK
jgi:mRNA-degrading endonuclease RelE of RelBE toxin-antitoxin system